MSGIRFGRLALLVSALALQLAGPTPARGQEQDDYAARLRRLDPAVLPERAKELAQMVRRDQQARLRAAAERENAAWATVKTREDWEKFRDDRVSSLDLSLGVLPKSNERAKVRVTKTLDGPGCKIENLVFETQPGLYVTANLYLPAKPPESMPGILIVHSHHHPRTQGELQDMGMTWANQGCAVLVPDMLGHGERRQHPFRTEKDYPGPFKVGRQDYYFRYNTGLQLDLVGDSLMGWMVWDLMRCLDVLESQKGVDPKRLIVLGSVAGGGDPAGVLAALDKRVAGVAPFNFGGVQPDYAVPDDPERNFYWFGHAYWEPSRCLRWGAGLGFAHWVIVGSVAPRKLLYSHEFAWDEARDPAWPRLKKVFELAGAPGNLATAQGKGELRGKPPASTHCNNIGPPHRTQMYPALKRWFGIPVPEKEVVARRTAAELAALTPEAVKELRPMPAHLVALARAFVMDFRSQEELAGLKPEARRQKLRKDWALRLGGVVPSAAARVVRQGREQLGRATVERLALEVEPGIVVPAVLLLPGGDGKARPPVVVAVAQHGKQAFLQHRADSLEELLTRGVAVCLPDVRGTGETSPGGGRGRGSAATSLSATEQQLGGTMLGARLRDLRSVVAYLRTRKDLDAGRLALWGDSFAKVNPPDRRLEVPLDAEPFPDHAEPLGGLLALFGALYDDGVEAVYVRGGLDSYLSLLAFPFVYVPHDAVVPGAVVYGDLPGVAGALAPRPLRLEGLVDGRNRRMPEKGLEAGYARARAAYRQAGAADRLQIRANPEVNAVGRWLADALRRPR